MIKELTLKYLGYKNQEINEELNKVIDEMIEEIKNISLFKITYGEFNRNELDLKEKAYNKFIGDCNKVILVASTLGSEVDKRILYYSKFDQTKSVILDAAGSAYIEILSDLESEKWGYSNLSYRFAPGYQGTSVDKIRDISRLLDANKKIGISILESNLIVPQKSLVGLMIENQTKEKDYCDKCSFNNNCQYRKS